MITHVLTTKTRSQVVPALLTSVQIVTLLQHFVSLFRHVCRVESCTLRSEWRKKNKKIKFFVSNIAAAFDYCLLLLAV